MSSRMAVSIGCFLLGGALRIWNWSKYQAGAKLNEGMGEDEEAFLEKAVGWASLALSPLNTSACGSVDLWDVSHS